MLNSNGTVDQLNQQPAIDRFHSPVDATISLLLCTAFHTNTTIPLLSLCIACFMVCVNNSSNNYNSIQRQLQHHKKTPSCKTLPPPPPPPALSASSYASNPKPRPRRVPSQASLVSAPLWVGLNGFPASREVLPGLARLLALLVAFTFSAVRLPPLWAAHARAWHRDTSSHHQRGRRLARSDWRRMEVDRVASGNLSSLSDHHNA